MKFLTQVIIVVLFANLKPGGLVPARSGNFSKYPEVTAPPESFFEKVREPDRQAARQFYKKYIDIKGMSVVASAEVADLALKQYDPDLFALVEETMGYKGKVDRRYRKLSQKNY